MKKNIFLLLIFFMTLFLVGYIVVNSLRDIYDCNQKNGVLVRRMLGGYVCLDGKDLK